MDRGGARARDPCSHDNCGSRRFHLGNDGYTYCDQGHQQSELGATIAEDTGDFTQFGRKHRKLNTDVESTTSRGSSLHGSQGFEHFLLCLQLVLRKQLRWLIDVQKFPQELEGLVKDLWSLRIRRLHERVPTAFDSDTEADGQSTRMYSSQSEDESGTDTGTATIKGAPRGQRHIPSLKELLSLNHIGMLLLRIPMTVTDLHRMVNTGGLLYYRARLEVPLTMRERLPGTYLDLLEPEHTIAPEALHRVTCDTLSLLNTDFGMAVPPLNHPLVLYRWVKELALPLEVYVATQRLARELDVDFCYTTNAPPRSRRSLRYPEVRLMALVVIATKLLFPFDERRRHPTSGADLSALEMDWHAWAAAHAGDSESDVRSPDRTPLRFDEAFNMSEVDVLELSDDRLDAYLDWCQRNIASDEIRETGRAGRGAEFRKALHRMFPLSPILDETQEISDDAGKTQSRAAERLLRVHQALRPKRVVPESANESTPRSGSSYVQYRDPGELSWPADVFHQKAAALAGWPLHDMVRAVFYMERRLQTSDLDRRQYDRGRSPT